MMILLNIIIIVSVISECYNHLLGVFGQLLMSFRACFAMAC